LTQGANVRIPETKYKRSNSIFFVTSIALICARMFTQMLQPLAQSLIGSPGILLATHILSPTHTHTLNPHVYIYTYVCIIIVHVHTYVVFICTYVYRYIYVCTHMYTYTYVYIDTYTLFLYVHTSQYSGSYFG